MREITADIHARLTRAGFAHVTVNTQLAPPWTTDWITERGPPQAGRQRHRPANPGPPPVRPHPADADRPAAGPPAPAAAPPTPVARPSSARPRANPCTAATPAASPSRGSRRYERLHRPEPQRPEPRPIPPQRGPHDFPAPAVARRLPPAVVASIDPLTDDSAAITFKVPADLAADFAFQPGQSLTVRRGEERRSYSICAPAGAAPRIGVREVADGAVSGWLVRAVKPGDTLDVQAPSGTFTPDLSVPGRHVLIAAGSGITPMMSIAASVLAADDKSTVTLIYGNRRSDTVMFADEVADLKDAHPARMHLVHVLSREPQEVELFSGRLDPGRLTALLPATVDVAGHRPLVAVRPVRPGHRRDRGARASSAWSPAGSTASCSGSATSRPVEATHEEAPAGAGASVTVILDGRSTALTLPAGTPILDGAQRVRPDLPFACKGGVCGTCRARVTRRHRGHAPQLRARAGRGRGRLRPHLPGAAADTRDHR